jgi:hypothetical protein
MSPAMAARVTDRLWDIGDIVKPIEDWETASARQLKRGMIYEKPRSLIVSFLHRIAVFPIRDG